MVTCTSRHSRNWQAGYLFGQGLDLPTVLARMKMVVEGIPTIKAAFRLSQREQIEMPIISAFVSSCLRRTASPPEPLKP